MFRYLAGTALQSAQISIARYCVELEKQSGAINIEYVISQINDEYRLVPSEQLAALINDIGYACQYLKNQQLEQMSRAGYWKFKAKSPFAAKYQLDHELLTIVG